MKVYSFLFGFVFCTFFLLEFKTCATMKQMLTLIRYNGFPIFHLDSISGLKQQPSVCIALQVVPATIHVEAA